jgi:hypothetical protein
MDNSSFPYEWTIWIIYSMPCQPCPIRHSGAMIKKACKNVKEVVSFRAPVGTRQNRREDTLPWKKLPQYSLIGQAQSLIVWRCVCTFEGSGVHAGDIGRGGREPFRPYQPCDLINIEPLATKILSQLRYVPGHPSCFSPFLILSSCPSTSFIQLPFILRLRRRQVSMTKADMIYLIAEKQGFTT